jgi:hypothetical protein
MLRPQNYQKPRTTETFSLCDSTQVFRISSKVRFAVSSASSGRMGLRTCRNPVLSNFALARLEAG